MNSHCAAPSAPPECWSGSAGRSVGEGAPSLPVWMGCCGWCCCTVCVPWWAAVGVPRAVLPRGCCWPSRTPEGMSLAGSALAQAVARLWRSGFSQEQAWCFTVFASAKPQLPRQPERHRANQSPRSWQLPGPASLEMELPGTAAPGLSCLWAAGSVQVPAGPPLAPFCQEERPWDTPASA